jgi:hypothetical protein
MLWSTTSEAPLVSDITASSSAECYSYVTYGSTTSPNCLTFLSNATSGTSWSTISTCTDSANYQATYLHAQVALLGEAAPCLRGNVTVTFAGGAVTVVPINVGLSCNVAMPCPAQTGYSWSVPGGIPCSGNYPGSSAGAPPLIVTSTAPTTTGEATVACNNDGTTTVVNSTCSAPCPQIPVFQWTDGNATCSGTTPSMLDQLIVTIPATAALNGTAQVQCISGVINTLPANTRCTSVCNSVPSFSWTVAGALHISFPLVASF